VTWTLVTGLDQGRPASQTGVRGWRPRFRERVDSAV